MKILKLTLGIFLVAATTFLACRKSSNSTGVPANADYFIFGKDGGFCGSPCGQYFKITGGKVYKSYYDSTGQVHYPEAPMSNDQYNIALPAMTNFPAYLTQHPNTNIRCTNCADMSFIHLEYRSGGKVYEWFIDYPYEGIPSSIQPYMDQVNNIISTLE